MGLGFDLHGNGSELVVVLHDWFSDCAHSYASVVPLLDKEHARYAFVDLRGYGRSQNITGKHTVDEAAADVVSVVEELGGQRFHVVGHSMSAMVAQKIAYNYPERVKSVIALTPVSASGSPLPEEMFTFLEDAAKENDDAAKQVVASMIGERYSDTWLSLKVKNWRSCSTTKARLSYLAMWANTDFSDEIKGLKTPFLVISGEYDTESFKMPALNKTFGAWYPNARIEQCKNAGHYPMQETPVFIATMIETYLREQS